MKREILKVATIALALCFCACGNDEVLNEIQVKKSSMSKFDDTQIIEIDKSFGAEGGNIYIDVTNKDWKIEYLSYGGQVSEIPQNIDFKRECVNYGVIHVYSHLQFKSTNKELTVWVYPNIGVPDGYDPEEQVAKFYQWGKSEPVEIKLILKIGDERYLYNISQGGVEDPSLYPYVPEKTSYTLPAEGGECDVRMSNAYFGMQAVDIDTDTGKYDRIIGKSNGYFPKEPVSFGNEWISFVRDGALIKVTAEPNNTGRERKCLIQTGYAVYYTITLTQPAE